MSIMTDQDRWPIDTVAERYKDVVPQQVTAAAALVSLLQHGLPSVAWSIYDVPTHSDVALMGTISRNPAGVEGCRKKMAALAAWAEHFDAEIVNEYPRGDKPERPTYRHLHFTYDGVYVDLSVCLDTLEIAQELGC